MAFPWAMIANTGINLGNEYAKTNYDIDTETGMAQAQTPKFMDWGTWLKALGLDTGQMKARNRAVVQFPTFLSKLANNLTGGGEHDPMVYNRETVRMMVQSGIAGAQKARANAMVTGQGRQRMAPAIRGLTEQTARMEQRVQGARGKYDMDRMNRALGQQYLTQYQGMLAGQQLFEPAMGSSSTAKGIGTLKHRTDWDTMRRMYFPGAWDMFEGK